MIGRHRGWRAARTRRRIHRDDSTRGSGIEGSSDRVWAVDARERKASAAAQLAQFAPRDGQLLVPLQRSENHVI
jgi:hypothetical protein